jgi:hypothetical protein
MSLSLACSTPDILTQVPRGRERGRQMADGGNGRAPTVAREDDSAVMSAENPTEPRVQEMSALPGAALLNLVLFNRDGPL